MTAWSDALHTDDRPRADAAPRPAPIARPGDSSHRRYALRALADECSTLRAAQEGVRNTTLNTAALKLGQLVAGGNLGERETVDALTDAARTCGLGEHEITATIASGMGKGMQEPREIPDREPRARSNGNGGGPDEPWEPSDSDAPDAPPESEGAKSPPPGPTPDEPLRGLKHLGPIALVGRQRMLEIAAIPIAYVWQGIVVAGTIVVIVGRPGDGKTTLLFLLIVARLSRNPIVLLGHRVTPAPVGSFFVLIEGEHSEGSSVRKLVATLALLGVPDDALDRIIIVARKAVTLGSAAWLDVVQLCAAGLVSDIALDTLARVAPGDPNDEQEQVAIFNLMAQAIERSPESGPKPNVWAILHTRKSTTGGLADISGSAQRSGQADSVLMISGEKVGGRTVSTTVTFEKLREAPDPYPEAVTFSIEKGNDGTPCIRLSNAEDGAAAADERPVEAIVTEVLRGGAQTKSALAKALGRSWKDIDEAITTLFAASAIRTGTPKRVRGRDYPTFELRDGFGRSAPHPADEFNDAFDGGEDRHG